MLLEILWVLDIFILIPLVSSYFLGEPEKGKFAYVALYIILIGVSYFIKETHPRIALFLAGVPVLIPILIFLFLIVVFNLKNVLK